MNTALNTLIAAATEKAMPAVEAIAKVLPEWKAKDREKRVIPLPAPKDLNSAHRASVLRKSGDKWPRIKALGKMIGKAPLPSQHDRVFAMRCRRNPNYRAKALAVLASK